MATHPLREFTDDHREAIERAVTEAESKTSAEIVVAVAGRSGRYDRAEDIFGLLMGLVGVAAAWLVFQQVQRSDADWQSTYAPVLGLPALLALFAFWTVAGAMLATRVPVLARPFITREEMIEQAHRRGAEAFVNLRVGSTADRAAILIFVSLFEHVVWICPDDAVAARLPDDAWAPLTEDVVIGFRSDRPVDAMVAAIRQAGAMLAPHFPPGPDDAAELPNKVTTLP